MGEVLTQVWLRNMKELFDKEVNAQKEENFRDLRKLPQAHNKVCNENETKKQEKNNGWLKIFDGRKELQAACGKLVSWISNDFRSTILHTLKVLFV